MSEFTPIEVEAPIVSSFTPIEVAPPGPFKHVHIEDPLPPTPKPAKPTTPKES